MTSFIPCSAPMAELSALLLISYSCVETKSFITKINLFEKGHTATFRERNALRQLTEKMLIPSFNLQFIPFGSGKHHREK